MTTKKLYSSDDARRAARRHESRSIEERLELARAILCSLANDGEPTYRGEENGRPYKGEPVWQWALKSLAYFAACASGGAPTDLRTAEIKWAVLDGIRMAREHASISLSNLERERGAEGKEGDRG